MLDERGLRALCTKFQIETAKGNSEEYNNKEKREKLRRYHHNAATPFIMIFMRCPPQGQLVRKK